MINKTAIVNKIDSNNYQFSIHELYVMKFRLNCSAHCESSLRFWESPNTDLRIIGTDIQQVESIIFSSMHRSRALSRASSRASSFSRNEQASYKRNLWTFYELFTNMLHIWERHTSVALDGDLLYLFNGN